MLLWIRSRGIKEDYTWKRDPAGGVTPDEESRRHLRLLDGDHPGVCLWRGTSGWGLAVEHLAAEGFRPAGGKITPTLVVLTESEAEARRISSVFLGSWHPIEQRLNGCVRLNDEAPGGWTCDFEALRTTLASIGDRHGSASGGPTSLESQRYPANDGPQSPSWQEIAAAVSGGPLPQRLGPLVVATGTPTSNLLDLERAMPRWLWRVAYRGATPDQGLPQEKKTTHPALTPALRAAGALASVCLLGLIGVSINSCLYLDPKHDARPQVMPPSRPDPVTPTESQQRKAIAEGSIPARDSLMTKPANDLLEPGTQGSK